LGIIRRIIGHVLSEIKPACYLQLRNEIPTGDIYRKKADNLKKIKTTAFKDKIALAEAFYKNEHIY
jgi:hypothetical protein